MTLRTSSATLLAATLIVAFVNVSPAAGQTQRQCQGQPATIIGTDGDDLIVGTDGPDVIVGLGGDDIISGLGGADLVCAGPGADHISGGDGPDKLYGNAGPDVIHGQKGADLIHGGWGIDHLTGGNGPDEIFGSRNADTIHGNAGRDEIFGGKGHDTLYGGEHRDIITGGNGNDILNGGTGNDGLRTGTGHDIANGDEGTDTINGQPEQAVATSSAAIINEEALLAEARAAADALVANEDHASELYERGIADEIFRLTNCARTGDYNTWCEQGDEDNWNVTFAERNPTSSTSLQPWVRDELLDSSARQWSYQIEVTDVFEHSPESGVTVGENIARFANIVSEYEMTPENSDAAAALLMDLWMNSPAHRSGILDPGYTTVGVGIEVEIAPRGDSAWWIEVTGTQQFNFG